MKKHISDRRIAVFIPFGANSDFQRFSKHNYAGKLSNGINVLKNECAVEKESQSAINRNVHGLQKSIRTEQFN